MQTERQEVKNTQTHSQTYTQTHTHNPQTHKDTHTQTQTHVYKPQPIRDEQKMGKICINTPLNGDT